MQLSCTAMSLVFAPIYENLSMSYYETKLLGIIETNCNLNFKCFLYGCEILLNLDFIKQNNNSIDNVNFQLSVKFIGNKLFFLHIFKTKTKSLNEQLFKTKQFERSVSYFSNIPKPCFKNIAFRLAKHLCMIIEKENVEYMKLKGIRAILKTPKQPKMFTEK